MEMYECPYAKGLQCSERKTMCDRLIFDRHCIMSILHNISLGIQANHNAVKRDGMEEAVMWLFDRGWIKGHSEESVSSTVDKIIGDLKMLLEVKHEKRVIRDKKLEDK